VIDPYRIEDGKLVPDFRASRAYAADLEARERAALARKGVIAALVAHVAPVVLAKLGRA
jgi:hypothetical protein